MAYIYNLTTVIARQVFADLIGPVGQYHCYPKNITLGFDPVPCDLDPEIRKDMIVSIYFSSCHLYTENAFLGI